MKRLIEGAERSQVTLLPGCLDDFIAEDNSVRVVDAFVEELELHDLGFHGTEPADTGRPSYHPAVLLKIYIYGSSHVDHAIGAESSQTRSSSTPLPTAGMGLRSLGWWPRCT